jgi:hypothetical protein
MLTEKEEFQRDSSKQTAVYIPAQVISSLKREFDVLHADVNHFVTCLIERRINEHIAESNSKVFSECETKEIEDDLKGLGYM